MPEALVGIGSNVDPVRALRRAAAALERRFANVRFSSVYRSAAARAPGADYLNAVAAIVTSGPLAALRAELRAIEAACGRTRTDPAVCELDLDVLLFGWAVDAAACVPREGASSLPFVLVPLVELRPALVHPLTGVRYAAALDSVPAGALERTPLALP